MILSAPGTAAVWDGPRDQAKTMDSPFATKTRPRVVQCITRLGLGGAEAVALTLVRTLRDEFEFAVFAVHGVEDSEIGRSMALELEGLRVPLFCGSRLPLKWGGLLPAGLRAARMSRDFKPALVHLHTEIPECAHAARLVLDPGGRPPAVVRTIHNTVYWHYWPRLGHWCERRLRHSHVACVSQAAQDAYAAFRGRSGAGSPPLPPVVIYNGVAVPTEAANRSHVSCGPRRILFAGRFEHQKGTDLLPAILAGVTLPSPGAELVLYGQGAHGPLLEQLAVQPPEGWKIHVLPPTAALRERMPEFDLVIMPSRFEGLPLVAVEAALLGVPLVATDAAGLRETLPPDHPWCAPTGDPAHFAQTLRQALATPHCWPQVAARARAFARHRFGPGNMAAGYRKLYARALS